MKYSVVKRKVKRTNPDGKVKYWESDFYYLSYYVNRKRVMEPIKDENGNYVVSFLIANKLADEKMKNLGNDSLLCLLETNKWFDPINSPLYRDSHNGMSSYKYEFAQSKRNTRCLDVVFHQLNDPLGNCVYWEIKKRDISEFKERMINTVCYVDAKGKQRDMTNTFRNNCLDAISTIYSYYTRTGTTNIVYNMFLNVEKFKKETYTKKYIYKPREIYYMFNMEVMDKIQPRTIIKDYEFGWNYRLTKERFDSITHSVYFDYWKFIAYTGLRGNEAAALTIDKFDQKYEGRVVNIDTAFKSNVCKKDIATGNGKIKVVGGTKTNEARKIVLCDSAYEIYKRLSAGKTGKELLFEKNGESIYTNKRGLYFRIFINEIEEQFQLEKEENEELNTHGFRTSLNTNLLENSPLKESIIAKYMGWSSGSLTKTQGKHYTQYGLDDLCEVAHWVQKIYDETDMKWKIKKQTPKKGNLESVIGNIVS